MQAVCAMPGFDKPKSSRIYDPRHHLIYSPGMPVLDAKQTDRVLVRRLSHGPSIDDAVVAVADEAGGFVLESTAATHPQGRHTILGFEPVDDVTFGDSEDHQWLERLRTKIGPGDASYVSHGLPFVGGWIGYIDYESGPLLERVFPAAHRSFNLPSVQFRLYDNVAVFDHVDQLWSVAALELPGHTAAARKLSSMSRWLDNVRAAPFRGDERLRCGRPRSAMTRDDYIERVARAKEYIASGDIYQVNLTQRFSAATDEPAIDLYRRLRQFNPAPLSCLLQMGESAVVGASPELFLELRGHRVLTRPIKGTRPRSGNAAIDRARCAELMTSEKDRAELSMIVDLLRNDLGRVSDYGTVKVLSDGDLESHPTVFHRVATIEGRLRDERCWADLLRAGFPGGSITGCPKIRAMQIIRELEPTRRSVYCGSVGTIGLDGSLSLNIAIRTMILDQGQVHLYGGGAIVADSDPLDEYDETLAKVAGLMRALGHPSPFDTDCQ